MRNTGSNMGSVRKNNRATILKYMNAYGPTSRKDLAEASGLTPAAVTQICTDLIGDGILQEVHPVEDVVKLGAGRKKILLEINYDVAYVYSINIELEQTTVAITNLRGELVAAEHCKTDTGKSPEEFLKAVAEACKKLSKNRALNLIACGVGIVGLVDVPFGISKKAYGIWEEEVPVADILQRELDLPIYLENNVNALALAEQYYGYGREHDNLMLIKWGPGVGCALIIDQEVYEGRHNRAAELGHFIVEPEGELCACGRRGCLETKVSYTALQKIKEFSEADFEEVYGTEEGFKDALDLFARSIVNSATMIAPNRIVLTGYLFRGEQVRTDLIKTCESYDPSLGEERIVYSNLSDKEDYIGPVAVVAREVLF